MIIVLEIMHAFSCLLRKNLRDGEMLFEIEKPRRQQRLLYFKQHFDTKTYKPYKTNKYLISILLLQQNRANGFPLQKNGEDRSVTLFLYKTAGKEIGFIPLIGSASFYTICYLNYQQLISVSTKCFKTEGGYLEQQRFK